LSLKIAQDDALLELCTYARSGQPVPNLLFGAVHYLLLSGVEHTLKKYYPSIVQSPRKTTDSFVYFKDFCIKHQNQIQHILQTRRVQTNEVRRCSYLFPCFTYIYNQVEKPLTLIEIRTSAGFQLLFDKYRYTYQKGKYGNPASTVHIESEVVGDAVPPFSDDMPPIASRTGMDLQINDVSDPNDALWLQALIWPEHDRRRRLFQQTVQHLLRHKDEITFIEGDGVKLLPRVASDIPHDTVICVFHTHVANQMTVQMKERLLAHVRTIGAQRDIFHLYNNIWDNELYLDSFVNGVGKRRIMASTDAHGRWFWWREEELKR